MIKNNNLKYTFFILLIFLSNPIISQNDLLGEIDYVNEDYKVGLSAFKAHKIINGQSTKQSRKKELFLHKKSFFQERVLKCSKPYKTIY